MDWGPVEAENVNGLQDDDGCPDTPPRVELKECAIEIREKVFFKVNTAKIEERSHSLLEEVAKVILSAKGIKEVVVEGHTDTRGKRRYNLKLSKQRARAVRAYLIIKGVDGRMLSAKGFGPDKPIMTGKTEEAHSKNRRVEFKVVGGACK